MKTKLRIWTNTLIGVICGLLGISSYSCAKYGAPTVMYGVPTGDLVFEGKVSDKTGKPLEGIQVIRRGGWKDGTNTRHWEDRADTLYTDSNGKIHKEYDGIFPVKYQKVIVNDPAGEYQSDSITSKVDYTGGNGWDKGKATLKTDFKLRKKKINQNHSSLL